MQWVVDRGLLSTFLVALVIRATTAVIAIATLSTSLVPDERQYVELATAVADGRGARAFYGEYGEHLYRSTFAFTGLLARIFEIVPPSRLPGALLSALFGAIVASITVVIARRVVTTRWALVAGLIVAALPSQVIWSSTTIRESMVWVGLAVAALVIPVIGPTSGRRTVLAILLGTVGLLMLGWLRQQTLVAGALSLAVAGLLAGPPRRWARAGMAVAIAILVPLLAGLGPLGIGFVHSETTSLAERRTFLSLSAETGFVAIRPAEDDAQAGESAAHTVIEDQVRGRELVVDETIGANLRHLPQGLVSSLFRPLPWDRSTGTASQFAKLENLVWVVLYVLAAIGLPVVWRRRDVLGYPFFVIVTVIGIGALTQGNVGTAFRHRGQILWAFAVLAVVGAERLRLQLIDR